MDMMQLPLLADAASAAAHGFAADLKAGVNPALHISAIGVGIAAVAVMLYGVVRATVSFIAGELKGAADHQRAELRSGLGYYILLGLELLIVADVIETITDPTLSHVTVLGLIVVIRTVISFSLNWELAKEAQHRSREKPHGHSER